jgi:hypothetical protein
MRLWEVNCDAWPIAHLPGSCGFLVVSRQHVRRLNGRTCVKAHRPRTRRAVGCLCWKAWMSCCVGSWRGCAATVLYRPALFAEERGTGCIADPLRREHWHIAPVDTSESQVVVASTSPPSRPGTRCRRRYARRTSDDERVRHEPRDPTRRGDSGSRSVDFGLSLTSRRPGCCFAE